MKNLIVAIFGQIFGLVIKFFSRSVFVRCLSSEYLGLNGLFSNILTMFSLAELGLGTAMNFSLYRPIAEGNIEELKSLMNLYKKAYRVIGFIIAFIGLGFTPFYTFFLEEIPNIPNLTFIYLLFVTNTVISYFYTYKRALILCDEKRYIATAYQYGFSFVLNVVQLISLILFHNYILYLMMQILFTFSENIMISIQADKMYPFLKEKNVAPISKETSTGIKKNIKATIFHKIGAMVVNSTDNLILSKYVGLAAVGLYSNYFLITNTLNNFLNQIFVSVTASVGNLNALKEKKGNKHLEETFYRLFFLNFWLYGFCSCCLLILLNPFISIWLGNEFVFDQITLLMIVVMFYLSGMRRTVLTFRDATGTFYYDRYKPIFESLINIIASIFLVRRMGTAGVFFGTIISTISVCVWVEPYVLYKYVFYENLGYYMIRYCMYTAVTIGACVSTLFLVNIFSISNIYVSFVYKMVVCAFAPNVIFFSCFFRTKEFHYFLNLLNSFIKNGLSKKHHW